MPAGRSLAELCPDVAEELREIALRVTQGLQAFRALRNILTDREWRQIEGELQEYFPSTVSLQAGKKPRPLPHEYALRTLVRLRNISQPRAIIDLALANDLLTDAAYRRLLREIGEGEPEPAPTKRPVWDATTATLRFENTTLRTFKSPKRAKNLVGILDAFETGKWVTRVKNPLEPGQQVHDAVKGLNRGLKKIIFHVQGDGQWLSWARR